LGISLTPSSYEDSVWQQEAGPTAFDPQPETSDLFKGTDKIWMLNFRVRDLDKMAAQLRAAGIAVEIDPQSYPNGRFASLHDPEGNPIQLWQLQSQPPRCSSMGDRVRSPPPLPTILFSCNNLGICRGGKRRQ